MIERSAAPDGRSVTPLVGVLALLAITVALAVAVAAGLHAIEPVDPAPGPVLELSADADEGTLALVHRRGEPIDVEAIDLTVTVGGEPLDEQPPVPFFQVDGFRGGPAGPFNAASDPTWEPGETASLRVAETNGPSIDAGDRIVVTVARDGERIATAETTAT